ncbi:hypothetical protein ACDX77_19370 [Bacillus velezensis]|uniref:hypothetical protein n=1 Tax=Bacillus amyloliquefaciens group TaxID=1938374 RepID=UPI000E224915|nr:MULTISPECIES: hypothetical protein [Bacillus amyloliquefaciens group]RDY83167.1 hypothetical protein C3733_20120 [Bacillus amyloliquefaciens]WFP05524.1 hypothetical protein JEQ22_20145 [Bacillus velezensis]
MEIVINIGEESIKEAFEKCGIPATRENMENLDTNQVSDLIYSFAYDSLEYVIKDTDTDPDTFISQKQYDQMVGSFSLDEFHYLADTEFREVAPESLQHMTFADALHKLQYNSPTDFYDNYPVGDVFCYFLGCVLDNFLFKNNLFSADEFDSSVPDFCIWEDKQLLEFHCIIESIFKRNNNKVCFSLQYVFSISDIQSEEAFQTALSAIEDSIKFQITGVYQNGSNS